MTNLDQEPGSAPALAPEILGYYAQGQEDGRLRAGAGRLELLRTQDVLRRLLPPAPARLLDVGGGSGIHAEWLTAAGYQVELVDPVPLHVEQAGRLAGVRARLGDARALDAADDSFDVVLLLGPLYHLTDPADRARALAEARRVLSAGGLLVAATINRFAGLHDTLNQGRWFDPERRPYIEAVTRDGRLRSENPRSGFTTAYFHQPAEIVREFTAAGLTLLGQYGVEGAGWLMGAVGDWLDDPTRRESLLDALRLAESDPALLGVSGHLLTAGRKSEAAR
ncbi:methyltransferase domain-containing protein [Kitasatospora sp. RB6PN24]|uniref:class I SAM-dependent methyltransferase n=1 Tax=Kitasatospora humi TaxID=2893891 RepID=UPI001E2A3474|nr:methyltransferase domain-containing protein [Kitasatospora humi]MCC9305974.1 methyltransferase domain-containing protein [Kitasatospora humi]